MTIYNNAFIQRYITSKILRKSWSFFLEHETTGIYFLFVFFRENSVNVFPKNGPCRRWS